MAAGEKRPIIVEPPDSAAISLAIRWRPRDPAEPLVVIIPTRDNGSDLGNFVASLRDHAERPDALHFLLIDNGSGHVAHPQHPFGGALGPGRADGRAVQLVAAQ